MLYVCIYRNIYKTICKYVIKINFKIPLCYNGSQEDTILCDIKL